MHQARALDRGNLCPRRGSFTRCGDSSIDIGSRSQLHTAELLPNGRIDHRLGQSTGTFDRAPSDPVKNGVPRQSLCGMDLWCVHAYAG
jgi:hypothetical protein